LVDLVIDKLEKEEGESKNCDVGGVSEAIPVVY